MLLANSSGLLGISEACLQAPPFRGHTRRTARPSPPEIKGLGPGVNARNLAVEEALQEEGLGQIGGLITPWVLMGQAERARVAEVCGHESE